MSLALPGSERTATKHRQKLHHRQTGDGEQGRCPLACRAHMAKGAKLADFPGGEKVPANTLLYTPCDVLIPAAIGGVITGGRRLVGIVQQPHSTATHLHSYSLLQASLSSVVAVWGCLITASARGAAVVGYCYPSCTTAASCS